MDYLNVEIKQNGFNWDDIDVGNNHLDHSENFFTQKHFKHEKLDDLELLNEQMAQMPIKQEQQDDLELVNEQIASAGLDDCDNTFTDFSTEDKENLSPYNKQQKLTNKHNKDLPTVDCKLNLLQPPVNIKSSSDEPPTKEPEAPELDVTVKPTKAPANIACMWSTQKTVVSKTVGATAAAKSMPPPPHAYEFKDLYERKKKEAIRRRLEEERKMRQFHSRPAPNFSAFHEQMERQKVVHAVTVAVTPQVLKNSRETDEKRRKKLEEWKRQHQPLKFESREPHVLKEEPFIPKKAQTVVQSRPFNLRSESRLQARKQYDETAQRAMKEKHKQEEEERKKREEERVRELRKLATFKARPNPFK